MRNEVNRAHKAKTTLRYLLSLIAILSVVSVSAATFGKPYRSQYRRPAYISQTGAQMPTATMGSTGSAMMQSGSALPMAAVSGTTMANDNAPGGPKRAKKDVGGGGSTDDGDEDPDVPGEPMPIGDAVLPLMLMAMLFAGVIAVRKKRAVKVNG